MVQFSAGRSQALARHASLSTTMKYMHLSPNATNEGIEMLTKSRDAGGVAVLGGFVPHVSPSSAK